MVRDDPGEENDMKAPERFKGQTPLTRADIAEGLRRLGLKAGDVVFVHSAMRTLGYVAGGPGAVVEAFLGIPGGVGARRHARGADVHLRTRGRGRPHN